MLVSAFNQNCSSKINTYPSYSGYKNSTNVSNKGVAGDIFAKSVSFTGDYDPSLEKEFYEELIGKPYNKRNKKRLLEIIEDPKFNINCTYWDYEDTPLHLLIIYNYKDDKEKLIRVALKRSDINPNQADAHGITPLMTACQMGRPGDESHIGDVIALLEHPQINISLRDKQYGGRTALDMANEVGLSNTVKILKAYQRLINKKEGKDFWGIIKRSVQKCLPQKANADEKTLTQKFKALIKGNIALEMLKEIVLSPNVKLDKLLDDQGRSPLHVLAETDTPDAVTLKEVLELIGLCLEKGVNIDAQDNLVNETALFGAYRKRNRAVAEFLLSKGADATVQNISGDTVFHYACSEGDEEMVKLILKYNPDLEIKNNQGKTGLDYAKEKNNTNIVNLINGYVAFKKSLE